MSDDRYQAAKDRWHEQWIAALTVGQLIEMLECQNRDLPVMIDGCDCTGPAGGVDFADANDSLGLASPMHVTITRAVRSDGQPF